MRLKLFLTSLCFILFIGSCSNPLIKETRQRNRAKAKIHKLIKKHDIKVDTIVSSSLDTLFLTDTITIAEKVYETLFKWQLDTILVIAQDGVTTEIQITTDTVYLKNIIHAKDTVIEYREIIKTITKEILVNTKPEPLCIIKFLGIRCIWVYLVFASFILILVYNIIIKWKK